MKQFKLTFVLTVLMSMVGLQAFADFDYTTKVKVGDLYYSLDNDNSQAEVMEVSSWYHGAIEIPPNIEYGGKTYSVTSIGDLAFSECEGLTSVTIPNSVTSISIAAFRNCSGLTSVEIPNSVTDIGIGAFCYCSGLTSVTIGNSVTSIDDEVFLGCSGLTSVTLNSNAIASKTYTEETNIKNIFGEQVTEYIIGEAVTSIGENAFNGCTGLTSVTIPNSVTSISIAAFNGCSGLKKVIVKDIAAWCKISFGGWTAQPLYFAKHLYSDENTEITDLVIPDGVTSIGVVAFRNCSGLTSVTIPNSVTRINGGAFNGCSGLTSVEIPNSVTSIHENAFSGCSGLTSVTIPNSVTSIGENAFNGCSKLTSITIPNSVTSIGSGAFRYCYKLTSITIPNSVTWIGNETFYYCSGLTSVTIPNSVTSIYGLAFGDCRRLTSVTIGNSVTSIGKDAFYDCSGLKKVIVKDIAAWCGISFGNAASNPLNYAHHLYSDENTEITDLVIPDGVTSIGERAFLGCDGLTSITIPESVTSIGNRAFSGCSGLTSIVAFNPTPVTINEYTFTNRANATLYVPKGSKDAYKAADYWKEFKEIVEMETTGIDQISIQENGNGEQVIDQEGAVWYTIDGKQIDKPKKGVNIIRMSDGTIRKVVVK